MAEPVIFSQFLGFDSVFPCSPSDECDNISYLHPFWRLFDSLNKATYTSLFWVYSLKNRDSNAIHLTGRTPLVDFTYKSLL